MGERRERRDWMGVMARAEPAALAVRVAMLDPLPEADMLRPPEIGAMMVRGRAGGTGAAFNLGEMTVTRCALTLESGEVGHAYIQGRRKADAEAAAIVDALMQGAEAQKVRAAVLAPLEAELAVAKASRAAKAAATKVEFFTMMRGED